MLTEILPLWQRIEDFQLDDATAVAPFSVRLARDNRWSLPLARRAILEYKRFILLAMRAGHPVTPSDAVDQVWHLHLTYTVSYWEALCRDVLGAPLHHGPTRGGVAESQRYAGDYARTLESYRRIFGEPAPEDLWPPASERFGRDLTHARLRTSDYWLLPKPSPRWRAAWQVPCNAGVVGPLWIGGVLLAPAAILFASGPGYLAFHLLLGVAGGLILWRSREAPSSDARRTPEVAVAGGDRLGTSEVAFLVGGPERVVQVGLVELISGGALAFDVPTRRLTRAGQAPADAHPVTRRLHEYVGRELGVRDVLQGAAPLAASLERHLQQLGLITSSSVPAAALLLVPSLLAIPRLMLGSGRGLSVALLVVASVVGVLVALALRSRGPRLTRLGLARLTAIADGAPPSPPERSAPGDAPASARPDPELGWQLVWQVALSGPVMLAGTDLAALVEPYPTPLAASAVTAAPASRATNGASSCGGIAGCAAGIDAGGGGCSGCGGGGCGGGCGGCGG